MTAPGGVTPAFLARVVVGALLIVAGVVLWLTLDASAWGLVSGVGVVLVYTAISPQIEERRSR